MKALYLLLVCCACNQAFVLEPTRHVDGAPPDAPFSCPPIGTAPAFARELHQVPVRGCSDYTVSASAGRAAGTCFPRGPAHSDEGFIGEGPVDAELAPILKFVAPGRFYTPRMTPDGDRLYVRHYDGSLTRQELYTRASDGWVLSAVAPFRDGNLSTIARDPSGDRMLIIAGSNWEELAQTSGSWSVVWTHTPAQLGVQSISSPSLSVDGLRLVFAAPAPGTYTDQVWYTDRTAVGGDFRPAVLLAGVPYTSSVAFMTEDCARVYVAGLERLFYVQQL